VWPECAKIAPMSEVESTPQPEPAPEPDAPAEAPADPVLTSRDGAVLTITLNRPDKLNALNAAVHKGLAAALREARAEDVRAVVITGAGRGFCVGQDLSEFRDAPDDIADRLRSSYHPTVLAIRAL
jgi:2-(1,2-epoxy-1,2-dihydrophenyl)acetyl-CoA isomerase